MNPNYVVRCDWDFVIKHIILFCINIGFLYLCAIKDTSYKIFPMNIASKTARKIILCTDKFVKRKSYDKKPRPNSFYEKRFLPAEASLLRAGNFFLGSSLSKTLKQNTHEAMEIYLDEEQKKDKKLRRDIEKEIIKCYLLNHTLPVEFFQYHLYKKNLMERECWLSDYERWSILHERFKQSIHDEINEKISFYQLAKDFFKRDVCEVSASTSSEDFVDFTSRHPDIFVKPMEGFYGQQTYKLHVSDKDEAHQVWKKLADHGKWIVEELIVQDDAMAAWNESSVNTVRLPSFITADGAHKILVPIIRTGAKDQIVDNTSGGGYYASIDVETGTIIDHALDKQGQIVKEHPGSGMTFKGWQVPRWKELLDVCERLHRSLPPYHRYIAFDFALSKTAGWVVIEANWGQLFGQATSHHGIRKEFMEYTKV